MDAMIIFLVIWITIPTSLVVLYLLLGATVLKVKHILLQRRMRSPNWTGV